MSFFLNFNWVYICPAKKFRWNLAKESYWFEWEAAAALAISRGFHGVKAAAAASASSDLYECKTSNFDRVVWGWCIGGAT